MSTKKTNSNIVKEAIADAKALRQTALLNAKIALEEAFAPKLKSMMEKQLNEDEMDELDENKDEENPDELDENKDEENMDELDEAKDEEDLDESIETTAGKISSENELIKALAKIEAYVKEKGGNALATVKSKLSLEEDADLDEAGKPKDSTEDDEEDFGDIEPGEVDEEIDIDSLLAEMEDEDSEDNDEVDNELKNIVKKNKGAQTAAKKDMEASGEEDLDEAHETINTLVNEMRDMNLLNSKLLYTNKLFKSNNLNESQKVKVLSNLDKAKTVREVKLVYNALNENFKNEKISRIKKSRSLTEGLGLGLASKITGKINKKKDIISEDATYARFQKIANIKK